MQAGATRHCVAVFSLEFFIFLIFEISLDPQAATSVQNAHRHRPMHRPAHRHGARPLHTPLFTATRPLTPDTGKVCGQLAKILYAPCVPMCLRTPSVLSSYTTRKLAQTLIVAAIFTPSMQRKTSEPNPLSFFLSHTTRLIAPGASLGTSGRSTRCTASHATEPKSRQIAAWQRVA